MARTAASVAGEASQRPGSFFGARLGHDTAAIAAWAVLQVQLDFQHPVFYAYLRFECFELIDQFGGMKGARQAPCQC